MLHWTNSDIFKNSSKTWNIIWPDSTLKLFLKVSELKNMRNKLIRIIVIKLESFRMYLDLVYFKQTWNISFLSRRMFELYMPVQLASSKIHFAKVTFFFSFCMDLQHVSLQIGFFNRTIWAPWTMQSCS